MGKYLRQYLLLSMAIVIGVGAFVGGCIACLSVQPLLLGHTYFGLSAEMLRHSPFRTFLLPGLFLLLVLGVGNLLTALTLVRKQGYYSSLIIGACLVAWIMIQMILLQEVRTIQVIFLVIGLIQLLLSLYQIRVLHQPIPFSAHQH